MAARGPSLVRRRGRRHARGRRGVRRAPYGFDRERFFLRVDFTGSPDPSRGLRIEWLEPVAARFELAGLAAGESAVERVDHGGAGEPVAGARACLGPVLEISIPIAELSARPRDRVSFFVQILEGGRPIETTPAADAVRLDVPDASFDATP